MKHEAIYKLHTNVVRIDDNEDGSVTCYDANDAVVTFSASEDTAITAKATELQDDHNLGRLRANRNRRLAETDHWALSDTAVMTQAQTDYRQALRDITDTYSSLDTVVWPTKP